jgi:NADH:ubiquinone oxidoreductase subunit K
MNLSIYLFLIGILGFILNRKNLILLLISIELMLLAVTNQIFSIDIEKYICGEVEIVFNLSEKTITMMSIAPMFITGIVDGDGSFGFSIFKRKAKSDFVVVPVFTIVAGSNPANYNMLILIKEYFGDIGFITNNKKDNTYNYSVSGIANCLIIKDHFLNFPLLTYKAVYFSMWCALLNLMVNKAHLTENGLFQIVCIKAAFKRGLNLKLREAFPTAVAIERPSYDTSLKLVDLNWLAGFITADGSFGFSFTENKAYKVGFTVISMIRIHQDVISLIVLESIIHTLGFGRLVLPNYNRTVAHIAFSNKEGITCLIDILIKNKLYGAKQLDFLDFCKGYEIIKNKEHLTIKGLEQLKLIASQMNSNRIFS